ncbi:MAG: hypothetical protein ACO1OB_18085 [Archangium sp.]
MAFQLSNSARYMLEADPVEHADGFHEPAGLRPTVSAVTALLRSESRELDRALLHTLISVDEPRADRVHLRLQHRGEVRPFRDVVHLLSRWPKRHIGSAIERIDTSAHWFDVDPREAYAKVVSTYTINYSNFMPYAPGVKRRFFTDPPHFQQGFLRAYLDLYDQGTDVTHMPGADQAAGWLRSRRSCRAQRTVVLRDDLTPGDVDVDALERELHEALASLAELVAKLQRVSVIELRKTMPERIAEENLPTDMQTFARMTKQLLINTPKQNHAGLVEVLTELHVPPGEIALAALALACDAVTEAPMPYDPLPSTREALPQLQAAQARLKTALHALARR